jgi:hypothetical protein
VKLARFRRPKAACFLSYVEYRPNTNTAVLWKIGHAKGKTQEGSYKKVNIVDVLSIQEWIQIFKPVETTIRKGLRQKNRDEPIRAIIHIYMEVPQ